MSNKPTILLCVLGFSPAVLTETLWCLTQGFNSENERFEIDDIYVITTKDGRDKLETGLLKPGEFERFKNDYPEYSHVKIKHIYVVTTEGNKIPDVTDSEDILLKDVRTDEENECVANQIYLILKNLIEKSSRLHASVAGGRKTMGIYLTVMMQLLARAGDTLSHVLVWDEFENNRNFFYPSPELLGSENPLPISLAFIPFIRLREVGQALISELTIGGKSYSGAVEKVRESLKFGESDEKLILNLKNLTVGIGKNETKISGIRMVLLLLYQSLGKGNTISDDSLTFKSFDEPFYRISGKRFHFSEVGRKMISDGLITGKILQAHKSLTEIDKLLKKNDVISGEEFLRKMREWRSRINNEVLKMKLNLSKKYFIQNKGEFGEAKFGFDVDVEVIE